MTDDTNRLYDAVSQALALADAAERHPIAAMLADVLAMIDHDRVRSTMDGASGPVEATPIA